METDHVNTQKKHQQKAHTPTKTHQDQPNTHTPPPLTRTHKQKTQPNNLKTEKGC